MNAYAAPECQTQHLTFQVSGEEYAIGILRVKEILRYETITRVPSTPPYIRGVINLRGSVVPVIDLSVKFGLPPCSITKRTCIIIVELVLQEQPSVMGLLADSVSEVIDLLPEQIEPPPPFGSKIKVDYLIGMGKIPKGLVLMLDIDKVLTTDEMQAAREVVHEAGETETVDSREIAANQTAETAENGAAG